MKNGRVELPLPGVLAVLLAFVVLPAIGIGLPVWVIDSATQERVERIQAIVQEVDESINTGRLEQGEPECVEPIYVEVEYYRDDTVVARDTYVDGPSDQCTLVQRQFYMNGRLIARDTFGPVEGIPQTVKYREYYNSGGEVFLREYFSGTGIGLTKEYLTTQNTYQLRRNTTRSPFPPLTLMFLCYR